MSLVGDTDSDWKLNKINRGPPFRVDIVGPWKLPQVTDSSGTVAISGKNGEVFCSSLALAEELCSLANDGTLLA